MRPFLLAFAVLAISATLAPAARAATGAVCLYKDPNYGGASLCFSADKATMDTGWNNNVSSVKVTPGYQVTLFDKPSFASTSVVLTADTAKLAKLNFDNKTSSVRVVSTTTAPKVTGTYYPDWEPSPLRIRDVNINDNLIYLFAARPVGGPPGTTGAVYFTMPGDGRGAATHLVEDIAYARTTQHRRIMLSVGGAGNGMSFPTRTKSQTFVNSIVSIYNQLGGFDGLDWNTFEGSQSPDTSEMIWISQQLKNMYPGFMISAPPAPWNPVDKTFCKSMLDAAVLDYCAPQYYDGPNLAEPDYVVGNVDEWVTLLGAEHVVVGFGINSAPNYMSRAQAIDTWNRVEAAHPTIHGGFDWENGTDETQNWPFANGVAPLILN